MFQVAPLLNCQARLGIGWYNLRSSTYESTRWIPQRPVSYWRYGYLQSFLLAFFACFTPGAQPPTNCSFARHKAPASLLLGFIITSSKIPTSLLCHRAYGIMPLWSFIPPVSGDPVSDWSMKISRNFNQKKLFGIIFWHTISMFGDSFFCSDYLFKEQTMEKTCKDNFF